MSRTQSGSLLHALLDNRDELLLVQIVFQLDGFPLNLAVESLQVYLKGQVGQQQIALSSYEHIGAAARKIAPLNQWR